MASRRDREQFERSTEHGDRGLYEMRSGLSSQGGDHYQGGDHDEYEDDDHNRGIRGWWNRHFRHDDDDEQHASDDGDHETHRSWFGGDDHDDPGHWPQHGATREMRYGDATRPHDEHIAGSRGHLARSEYSERDDARSQFMRGGVDMRDSSLRDRNSRGGSYDRRDNRDMNMRGGNRDMNMRRGNRDMNMRRDNRDMNMRGGNRDMNMRGGTYDSRTNRDRNMRGGNRDTNMRGGGYDSRSNRDMNMRSRDMQTRNDMRSRDNNYGTDFSREDMRSAPLGYSRGGHDEHGWATEGFRDTTSRGGFGGRGQFDRIRDQNGHLIDERGDQRHYYTGGAETASRSEWHDSKGRINPRNYTDEDENDRQLRGYRGDVDNRSRQFIGDQHDNDDMRGQFHRSRNDGELGRQGSVGEARYISDPRRREHQHQQGMQMNRDDIGQRTEWYGNEDRSGSDWRGGGGYSRRDHSSVRPSYRPNYRPIDEMRDMHGSGGMSSGQQQHGREYDGGRDTNEARRMNEWSTDVHRTNPWDRGDSMMGDHEPHHIPRGASSIDNPNQGGQGSSSRDNQSTQSSRNDRGSGTSLSSGNQGSGNQGSGNQGQGSSSNTSGGQGMPTGSNNGVGVSTNGTSGRDTTSRH